MGCVCAGVWTCDHLILCILWEILSLITKKHLLIVENKISILIWLYTAHNQLFGVQGPGPKGTTTRMLWRQCWQVEKVQDNWRTYPYMWHRISWGPMRVMKQYALLKLKGYLCNACSLNEASTHFPWTWDLAGQKRDIKVSTQRVRWGCGSCHPHLPAVSPQIKPFTWVSVASTL